MEKTLPPYPLKKGVAKLHDPYLCGAQRQRDLKKKCRRFRSLYGKIRIKETSPEIREMSIIEIEHNWGPVHIAHVVIAGVSKSHHQRLCFTCGIVQKYGREYGSKRHPGFSAVDQNCSPPPLPATNCTPMSTMEPSTSSTTEYYYYDDKQRERDHVKQRAVKYLAERAADQRLTRQLEINRRRLEYTEIQKKEREDMPTESSQSNGNN